MRTDIQARRMADARASIVDAAQVVEKSSSDKRLTESAEKVRNAAGAGRPEIRQVYEIEAFANFAQAIAEHLKSQSKSSQSKANASNGSNERSKKKSEEE